MPHCIYEDPKDILTFFDIEDDRLLTDGIVLIFFFFGMRLLAFLALKIKVLLILYENTGNGFSRWYFSDVISYRLFQVVLYTETLNAHIRYGCFGKNHQVEDFSATNQVFIENEINRNFRNISTKTESSRTFPIEPSEISLNNLTEMREHHF